MSTWARIGIAAACWFVVGIPVGIVLGKHLKRQRERYYPPAPDEQETP